MNIYSVSALIAFVLLSMGLAALAVGGINYKENPSSKRGLQMLRVCICVFVWNLGYAWMSLCYEDNFAYVPRAFALLAVTFYMFFILKYVALVTKYPGKRLNTFLWSFVIFSLIAWFFIIQKSAVSFTMTEWGYWYISKMSWARILQFACILWALLQYYVILNYGLKRVKSARERVVLQRFGHFGWILFIGYMVDTLLPSIFHIAAVPGSCISAFISAMVLFGISRENKTFGLSKVNVSEYVFEDVTIPVIITDSTGEIVLCNAITEAYLGCKEEDILQKELGSFFEDFEEGLVKVKGSDRICKLDKTEVIDQYDELQYAISFVQDVTKERTHLKMLQESRQQAEEASRAKSNFLANMSHEIRTPMNAIIGMSNILLQDKELPEKTLAQIEEIKTAGNNLLGIINDVLDISKIENGKYELLPSEYELPSLLNDVNTIIQVRVQESNTKFVMEIDPSLPKRMYGDEVRIRQILLNILGNAAKFTQKGTITLRVFWCQNQKNAEICFDVIDTGIGIKPEDISKIFGEFNQVDTRKNRNIQGTGLGLAISKHLAELMGGDITVESVYGQGSTFHIVISQEVKQYKEIGSDIVNALQNHKYHLKKDISQIEIVQRPNAKVLVVDDTRMNLMVATGILKMYGMQIDTADSGRKALQMVQEKDYDIVFMDHMMPELDGVDTTRLIRAMGGKYEKLVIIALSANVLSEAQALFLNEGMQDFVGKPIEMDALDKVINRWLPVTDNDIK